MFQAIADFINLIFTALNRLANPLGGISVPSADDIGNAVTAPIKGTMPNELGLDVQQGTKPTNEQSKPSGKRAPVTIPENITARFDSRGSPAWFNQVGPLGKGYHYGTDFGAPPGSPVFAPYAGKVIKIGHYDDAGRLGDYVMLTLQDGAEYYSGHLNDVKVAMGDSIQAGQQLGVTNLYAHTHVQLRVGGVLRDFEVYMKTH